ncbi:MAG: hypothetical protein K9J21_10805 [Bacteroidales bacterium]|jgi:hypothetical protein|nr:hypothetical protein [Bacteroidales bacterium]
MKRKIKFVVILGLLSLLSLKGFSQMSVSYYSSSLSKIGLAYNFSDKIWSELRLYSNTSIDDLTPELVLCYNIVEKEKHNVYLGLGGNMNYFTGFVLPVGVQFTPVEKFKRFSLHIELQPTLDLESDLMIQSSWGLRYKFGKSD